MPDHPEYQSPDQYTNEEIDCLAPNESRTTYCVWLKGHPGPHAWDADELRFQLEKTQVELEHRRNVAHDDLVAAFLAGAKYWEYCRTEATTWQSDQKIVIEEACRRYPTSPINEIGEAKFK